MLPLKLRLRNFLSYGDDEVTLDFSPLRVACLSGENGAGKSALFDAITWALWGRARGFIGGEELIHRGAAYAEVELHFETAGGDVYRAFRVFDRSKTAGQNYAYLHRVNGGELHLIAEKVRSVDNAIHELIRVEYDTFIASAYLRQGDADYFTNTTKLQKRQRKELLIDLLDLGRFEPLSALAKTTAARLKSDIEGDESVLDMLKEKVGQIPEAETELLIIEKKAETASTSYTKRRNTYDELQGRSQRFAGINQQLETLEKEVTGVTGYLQEVTDRVISLDKKKSEYGDILAVREEVSEEYEKLQELEGELKEHDRKLALLNNLEQERRKLKGYEDERRRAAEAERNDLKRDLAVLDNDLKRLDKLIGNENDIQEGTERYNDIGDTLEKLRGDDVKRRDTKERVAKLRAEINAERKGIEATLIEKEKLYERFDTESAKINKLETKIEEQKGKLARARQWLKDTEEYEKEVSRLETDIERRREKIAADQEKLQDIEERRNLLETGDMSFCPVCDREFDKPSRKAASTHINAELKIAQYELEKSRNKLSGLLENLEAAKGDLARYREKNAGEAVEKIAETLTANRTRLEELIGRRGEADKVKQDIEDIKKAITELYISSPEAVELEGLEKELEGLADIDKALRGAEKEREEMAHFPAELERLEKAATELKERKGVESQLQSGLEKVQKKLRADFFTGNERAKIEKIEDSLDGLDYGRSAHKETRAEVEEKTEARERFEILNKADGEVNLIDKELALLNERKAALRENLEGRENERAVLRKEADGYEGIEGEMTIAGERLQKAETARDEAKERLGAARQRLSELEAARTQIKEIDTQLDARKDDFRVYSYLEKAFGRDGIPTLMLERGLDELENIANEILAGLTRGRISLGIRTEASKKSGKGMKDVFDVEVSNNGVARKYGLFSGGERFRVDFALRVALSQLLARRAGAPLRFLIVDEGFGTQDPDGLAAMVEAINEISSRFELILVISHLPSLRDRFPVRVEVSKDASGVSSFEVVGA